MFLLEFSDLDWLSPFILRMPNIIPPQHRNSRPMISTADAGAPEYIATAPATIARTMQIHIILITDSPFVQ
ncbi:MAG TPA: hypothetical protein VJ731_11575 [Terriglobales bacterium]|nr:hypothetical protein [Terriglobales bacterium]